MTLRITNPPLVQPFGQTSIARRLATSSDAPVQDMQQVGFSRAFKDALHSVSSVQHRAARLQDDVQMEKADASLEETMIAMQKAQVGFQSVLHVRNRMLQAYSDIMNMQV